MTVDEYVKKIVPYFLDQERDVLKPLESGEYTELVQLIDRAIDEYPNDCAFWFWRGWALQFFSGSHEPLSQHWDFELIEDAYMRVVELDSERTEAYFMLAYLYWDSARRAKTAQTGSQPDVPEPDLDPEIASFHEARRQWIRFRDNDGVSRIMHVDWMLYPFQARAWSELLKRMLADIVAPEDLMVVYLSWGYHWLDCEYGADDPHKRREAYERARWAFAQGAALADDEHTYGMRLDCRYLYARLQSAKYGGDPVVGLRAWLAYIELAVECGRKYGTATPPVPCYNGNNTDYTEDEIERFWNQNPSLEGRNEPLDIIMRLEALGALDLSKPGNGKLKWYLGRRFDSRRELDKAEYYLAAAQHELPSESDLIQQWASVLKKQGKTKERTAVLRLLPDNSPVGQLVRELAEENRSLHDFEELMVEIRQMRITEPEITPDQAMRRKCAADLPGTWPLLSTQMQDLIVTGEVMHSSLQQNPVPDYSSLIIHWGKVTETLLRDAVLAPFACYLNKTGHRNGVLVCYPLESGKFKSAQIEPLAGAKSWAERFMALKAHEMTALLYAARNNGANHIYHSFLAELKLSPQQIAVWLNLVPDQVEWIRERRNGAAHGEQRYILSDALDVRSILFTGGLIAQIGILLRHSEKAGRRSERPIGG